MSTSTKSTKKIVRMPTPEAARAYRMMFLSCLRGGHVWTTSQKYRVERILMKRQRVNKNNLLAIQEAINDSLALFTGRVTEGNILIVSPKGR